jgi:hypothetical protein
VGKHPACLFKTKKKKKKKKKKNQGSKHTTTGKREGITATITTTHIHHSHPPPSPIPPFVPRRSCGREPAVARRPGSPTTTQPSCSLVPGSPPSCRLRRGQGVEKQTGLVMLAPPPQWFLLHGEGRVRPDDWVQPSFPCHVVCDPERDWEFRGGPFAAAAAVVRMCQRDGSAFVVSGGMIFLALLLWWIRSLLLGAGDGRPWPLLPLAPSASPASPHLDGRSLSGWRVK